MTTYLARRALATLPVLFGVSVVVFIALRWLPSDPALILQAQAARGNTAAEYSPEQIARIRHDFGLDDPIHMQYLAFVGRLLQGDLGRSFRTSSPVTAILAANLPHTLELTLAGMAVAVLLGLALGILAAVRAFTLVDYVGMVLALLGISMPAFWLGLVLIYLFGVKLHWLPIMGQGELRHLVLPAVTLGLAEASIIARLVRSSLLDVLHVDYIRTARAKGLGERAVVTRHALKNAFIPVVTFMGLQFGSLLAGTVVIETVFTRQGLGAVTVNAILQRDYPVVQATVLLAATTYLMLNLLVDCLYAYLDPRIRYR